MNDPNSQSSLLKTLSALDRGIVWFEAAVLSGGVLGMAVVSIANVVGRELLGNSLAFADEVNQAFMILITFVGIGFGVRRARHIRMSAFYDQLGGRVRKTLLVIISLVTAVLLLALAWFGFQYAQHVWRTGSVTPALRMPLYLVYLWVPVGFTLGAVQYLLAVWRNLTDADTWLSFTERDEYQAPGDSGATGAL